MTAYKPYLLYLNVYIIIFADQVFIDPAFFGIFVCGPLQSFMVNVNFVSTVLYCVALVYNSYIFSEHPFKGNYSTFDSHTKTVISYAVAYI